MCGNKERIVVLLNGERFRVPPDWPDPVSIEAAREYRRTRPVRRDFVDLYHYMLTGEVLDRSKHERIEP